MIGPAHPQDLTIAVFGLGYVGTTCAAFFAGQGHRVLGVECDRAKAEMLAAGRIPFAEPGLEAKLREAIDAGTFELATNPDAAIADADISLICVGTPTDAQGRVHVQNVFAVTKQIGLALAGQPRRFHVIALRSTCPPGTTDLAADIIAQNSGLAADTDFAIAHNPEFLREGSALADMARPPFTVIGSRCEAACEVMRALYRGVDAPIEVMGPVESELLKYASNVFHAAKVAFANEIGDLAEHFGADPHRIMHVFCRDRQLNISSKYLRPGFAFGGSCLPKDVRALAGMCNDAGLSLPLAQSVIASNDAHLDRVTNRILAIENGDHIGILGLAFKPGSDDLRESPYVRLARKLLDAGRRVRICEPTYIPGRVLGANLAYVRQMLPELDDLRMDLPQDVVGQSRVVILSRAEPPFQRAVKTLPPGAVVVDLSNRKYSSDDRGTKVGLGADWNAVLKRKAKSAQPVV